MLIEPVCRPYRTLNWANYHPSVKKRWAITNAAQPCRLWGILLKIACELGVPEKFLGEAARDSEIRIVRRRHLANEPHGLERPCRFAKLTTQ